MSSIFYPHGKGKREGGRRSTYIFRDSGIVCCASVLLFWTQGLSGTPPFNEFWSLCTWFDNGLGPYTKVHTSFVTCNLNISGGVGHSGIDCTVLFLEPKIRFTFVYGDLPKSLSSFHFTKSTTFWWHQRYVSDPRFLRLSCDFAKDGIRYLPDRLTTLSPPPLLTSLDSSWNFRLGS